MSDAFRRELERWGFSETETEVYLAVLETGGAPATEVAELADVSTRHVYRVCGRLEERGFVDVDEHVQPTSVQARPPSAVSDVLDRSVDTLTDEIASAYSRSSDDPDDIEVLKRQATVLSRARTLIQDAARWLVLVAPPDVVEVLTDELAGAVDRGVLVLLVTSVEGLSVDRPVSDLATVIRTRESPKGFHEVGLGVDTVRALIVSDSDELGDEHRHSPALFLHDRTIAVRVNESLLGIEWQLGTEHTVPDPPELPCSSDLFRKTVTHAALHKRAGTDLRATVQARSIADGRNTPIEGEVVEVRQGYVEPSEQEFLGERTLVLETDEGRVTVGGRDASVEDYAARSTTLFAAEDEAATGDPAEADVP